MKTLIWNSWDIWGEKIESRKSGQEKRPLDDASKRLTELGGSRWKLPLLNSGDGGQDKRPQTDACKRLTELGGAKRRATFAEQ